MSQQAEQLRSIAQMCAGKEMNQSEKGLWQEMTSPQNILSLIAELEAKAKQGEAS